MGYEQHSRGLEPQHWLSRAPAQVPFSEVYAVPTQDLPRPAHHTSPVTVQSVLVGVMHSPAAGVSATRVQVEEQ